MKTQFINPLRAGFKIKVKRKVEIWDHTRAWCMIQISSGQLVMCCVWWPACPTASGHAYDEATDGLLGRFCPDLDQGFSSAPGQSVSGVVCRRWMQENTISHRCSIGFRIALMPSSRSYWHTPATWDLQQEEPRPTALETRLTVGLVPGKPLWLPHPVIENAIRAKKGWNHFLTRGCLTSSPVDCLVAETACQIDVLLLPNWTDWFPWSVVDLDLYCDDAVLHLLFVQVIHKHRHVEPSHPEAVAGVLFLTALLLWNSQYYSGLLWCYKYLSICPHLLLTVFCPGASSEPCPERWMRLKASFMADRDR